MEVKCWTVFVKIIVCVGKCRQMATWK